MSDPHAPAPDSRYLIRIQGHLDADWNDWFDGLTIDNQSDGTTTLSGVVIDQAELHGVLRTIGRLGITLISVTAVNPEHPPTDRSNP